MPLKPKVKASVAKSVEPVSDGTEAKRIGPGMLLVKLPSAPVLPTGPTMTGKVGKIDQKSPEEKEKQDHAKAERTSEAKSQMEDAESKELKDPRSLKTPFKFTSKKLSLINVRKRRKPK
eukprot:Gregarina_sp_Poly_1__4572@NODE_2450_length_2120_cov_95_222601_g1554_i0_p2_GENE_NODE_2450_length_2120_cov_95_222601_g1554_i0NODE_2450_length_2120_cov_95_222601_g1554_i0_p2_ORF_typecomplete_len119_score23_89_NODE_2450_length_2120_cov_95_222601_g1554_i0282638